MMFVKNIESGPVPRLRRSVFDVIPQVEMRDDGASARGGNQRWITYVHSVNISHKDSDGVTQRKKNKLKKLFS